MDTHFFLDQNVFVSIAVYVTESDWVGLFAVECRPFVFLESNGL